MKIIKKITFLSLLFATVLNGMDKNIQRKHTAALKKIASCLCCCCNPKTTNEKSRKNYNLSIIKPPSSYVASMEEVLKETHRLNFAPIASMIALNLEQGLRSIPEKYFAPSNTKIIINALINPVSSKKIPKGLKTKIRKFANSLNLDSAKTTPMKYRFLQLLKETISIQTTSLIPDTKGPDTKGNIGWLPYYICNTVKPHLKRKWIRYKKIWGWYENPISKSRRKTVQPIYNKYLENNDTLKLLNIYYEQILHLKCSTSGIFSILDLNKALDKIKVIGANHSKKRLLRNSYLLPIFWTE